MQVQNNVRFVMLLARNGFEFESAALSLREFFFFPRLLTGDRLRRSDGIKSENRTDFIPISAKALMPLCEGVNFHPSLGYRWLSRENICLAQTIAVAG